ncbi:MAG TPA: SpoIID/LytB domain-containing protein [Salinivirgaceae bacterium]|nr:SpoIID/LytB domain-containing protein [Salinivirgaceae bacterium]HQA76431.1 SpoIID/LytB domain-containing protein [Salinivirgaceae bacterium]
MTIRYLLKSRPLFNINYRFLILFIITFPLFSSVAGQNIRVGLYRESEIRTIIFKVLEGFYTLTNQDSLKIEMKASDILFVTSVGNRISLWNTEKHLGIHSKIQITSKNPQHKMMLDPVYPTLPARNYYGNFDIWTDSTSRVTLVNIVSFQEYLAGVVEAESGVRSMPEYYKAQAIICRTYALNHIDRHQTEGFHLCDEVHCQVYKGFGIEHGPILKAVDDTKGLVIVDNQGMLITAAFHSNSGGYTANSEDVWSTTVPYLRGKPDIYYDKQRNSNWEKSVSIDEWVEFLKTMNIQTSGKNDYSFSQSKRQRFALIDNQPVLLGDIRNAFKLKSTFFSFENKGNKIVFKGKGYGHGVGLSQESAMEMARQGESYSSIIEYFYTDVKIIDLYETTYLMSLLPE